MVIKKTNKKPEVGKKAAFDDFYVCMQNAKEKRKQILCSIKDALFMQEEYEKVMHIRKNKQIVIKEIKAVLKELNEDYQLLRKDLPEVKNVLSYTEKEIYELESEIGRLKKEIKTEEANLVLTESLELNLKENGKINIDKLDMKSGKKIVQPSKAPVEKIQKAPIKQNILQKAADNGKLNKLDRIRNNLKVIEDKINHM